MENYLIIGASSGIGKAIAQNLSKLGHRVYGTYCKNSPTESHPNLSFHPYNVLDTDADFSFLPENLNGIVYCPGSIHLKPFERISPTDFLNDYQLQVIGAIKTIQSTIGKMKKSNQACIVLFSTIAVQKGLPFHTQVAASKGAIEGLTKALAAEYAPKIRVNGIAPSLTDTPLAESLLNNEQKRDANAQRHPLKRIGTPEDIAELASFLVTEKSSWITGQIIHIDGGLSTLG